MMKRAWSQPEFVGPLLLAIALATAWACSSASRSSTTPTIPAAAVVPTDTAVPCTDENAIGIVRKSVVRISTDAAVGTGIVVGDNQILTNAHVVEDNGTVRVQSQDGAEEGTVVGTDKVVDLALIQAATHALPAVKFADPSSLKPGQRLLAIGYALDLPGEPSTTGGIFSALREIDGVHYVQTDAPINPGNSGGPLFTQCGEVVGLNTLGNRAGIGFAIDSAALRTASSDLALATGGEKPPPKSDTPKPQYVPTVGAVRSEPTSPISRSEAPTPMCGEGDQVSVIEPQINSYLPSDEPPDVVVRYDAPSCGGIRVEVKGVYDSSSAWYEFYCGRSMTPRTCYGWFDGMAAVDSSRVVRVATKLRVGAVNAPSQYAGLRICQVSVWLIDLASFDEKGVATTAGEC